MMQCYQSPAAVPSFFVKDFNPAKSIQRVLLSEVYRSESSSKKISSDVTTSESSSALPRSADARCISTDSKESLRWARMDVKLMHVDLNKFLKQNRSGNSNMAAVEYSGQKTLLRRALKDSLAEKEADDSDSIKKSLLQLVEPKM
jgi:hypothetical protein